MRSVTKCGGTIRYMPERIKSVLRSDRFFFMTLVVLVGLLAYGLGMQAGRLAVEAELPTQPAVVFQAAPDVVSDSVAVPVVASRSGTKYHRLDCPGAETIKEANLIRFASTDLARAAGYTPASNCAGLE